VKITIAGDGATGTSSICRRLSTGEFLPYYSPTTNRFNIKTQVHDESIRVLMWPRPTYFAGPDGRQLASWLGRSRGHVLVYDITNEKSFENLHGWLDKALSYSSDIPIAIVGNKADLIGKDVRERRQYSAMNDTVDPSNGRRLAESISSKYNVPTLFMETSAKTGQNINRLFSEFTEIVVDFWERIESD